MSRNHNIDYGRIVIPSLSIFERSQKWKIMVDNYVKKITILTIENWRILSIIMKIRSIGYQKSKIYGGNKISKNRNIDYRKIVISIIEKSQYPLSIIEKSIVENWKIGMLIIEEPQYRLSKNIKIDYHKCKIVIRKI